MKSPINYKSAGVDIAAGNEAVTRIKDLVHETFNPQVLTSIGSFGAMYDLASLMQQYQHPVLVQSIDGVGTKIMIAQRMQKFDTIGIDLVSATANDIVVLGAKPLTLLDYIANDKIKPEVVEEIILGMAKACRENNIALIGGETAEMPGTYVQGEHDLVGVITGVVEKEKAILGNDIRPGDCVLALPSSGLHTNGYSLARKLVFEVGGYQIDSRIPDLPQTLGETLLEPHLNYTQPVLSLLDQGIKIKGMAHITGGGILENIPRILPKNCSVQIRKNICPVLPIFSVLRSLGRLNDYEMYRTFNMGIGLIMIVAACEIASIQKHLQKTFNINVYNVGDVVLGEQQVRLI